jgi:hypothetical protein
MAGLLSLCIEAEQMNTTPTWMPPGAPAQPIPGHQQVIDDLLRHSAERAAELQRTRAKAEATWAGITPRSAVLLTAETSRRLMPSTARHPHAGVVLDGLVEQIDLDRGRALVRILLLTTRAGQQTHSEVHWLERSEIDRAAGHPPSVWDPLEPHRTAVQRAHNYGPEGDPWLSWRPQRQWEAQP